MKNAHPILVIILMLASCPNAIEVLYNIPDTRWKLNVYPLGFTKKIDDVVNWHGTKVSWEYLSDKANLLAIKYKYGASRHTSIISVGLFYGPVYNFVTEEFVGTSLSATVTPILLPLEINIFSWRGFSPDFNLGIGMTWPILMVKNKRIMFLIEKDRNE